MSRISRRNFVKSLSASVAAAKLRKSAWANVLPVDALDHGQEFDLKLWFDKPAEKWVDALPIGNGRLGAMVFGGQKGGPAHELLQMNETTLWSGILHGGNNLHAKDLLPAVRDAVLTDRNYHLADDLCRKMQGKYTEAYQPLGDLRIKLIHKGPVSLYRRELDLDTACAAVSYTVNGPNGQSINFKREIFSFAPDNAIVVRLTGSATGCLSGSVELAAELQRSLRATKTEIVLIGKARRIGSPAIIPAEIIRSISPMFPAKVCSMLPLFAYSPKMTLRKRLRPRLSSMAQHRSRFCFAPQPAIPDFKLCPTLQSTN